MISVEQILLLQQKVESAVQKIEQLKSENDALRAERSELTKALSEKSELLSRFSDDQKKIEDGILGALNRLDSVENALLDSGGNLNKVEAQTNAASAQNPVPTESEPVKQEAALSQPSFQSQEVQTAQAAPSQEETQIQASNEESQDDGLFGGDSFETEEEGDPDIF